eukprot:1162023-Pelagomonas_calceolata.AAC.7
MPILQRIGSGKEGQVFVKRGLFIQPYQYVIVTEMLETIPHQPAPAQCPSASCASPVSACGAHHHPWSPCWHAGAAAPPPPVLARAHRCEQAQHCVLARAHKRVYAGVSRLLIACTESIIFDQIKGLHARRHECMHCCTSTTCIHACKQVHIRVSKRDVCQSTKHVVFWSGMGHT